MLQVDRLGGVGCKRCGHATYFANGWLGSSRTAADALPNVDLARRALMRRIQWRCLAFFRVCVLVDASEVVEAVSSAAAWNGGKADGVSGAGVPASGSVESMGT
jgi:hypothetical protein